MTLVLDRRPARAPAASTAARRSYEHPAVVALLAATAVLYLWGLGSSGWANTFYSAAVQAGTKSWKAFFFGSSDAANFITVDKSPGSLWPMEIAARIFGVNPWSILVPQALEGVASVGLLYAAVRRWFGVAPGLVAGTVLALTPVATLMFRFNNPDALLVLAMTAAAYAIVRATEGASTRWLVAAGGLIGVAFLAKMLQAFLVVPAFALVYLVAAPVPLRRRIVQLAAAGLALLASAGWWVAAMVLIPAADRPYIGGSQDNSVLNLLFGYNGFGRLTGNEAGSVGGATTTANRWGLTGLTRMFNREMGGQIAWLLPAALILLGAGLVMTWHRPRTDRVRAALVLWGGWLFVTGVVFSYGQGIIHPYYTVALAPAIGGIVAIGGGMVWSRRSHWAARATLAATLAVTAGWGDLLLLRTPAWHPLLRSVVLAAGMMLAFLLLVAPHLRGKVGTAFAVGGLSVGLMAPAASSLATAATTHSGAIPSAGPATAVGGGFRGGGFGGGGAPGGGGGGGLLDGSTSTPALTATLQAGRSRYTWVAAVVLSNEAAGYQLATGDPVMAIGGFNGTDPAPTLAQFEALVRAGRIHYFIAGSGFGGPNASSTTIPADTITAWVEQTYAAQTVGGTTIYDLTP